MGMITWSTKLRRITFGHRLSFIMEKSMENRAHD